MTASEVATIAIFCVCPDRVNMTITLPDNVNDNPDRVFISLRLKLRFDFLLVMAITPIDETAVFLLILLAIDVCND